MFTSQLATLIPLFVRLELTHLLCEVCGVLGGFLGGRIFGMLSQDIFNGRPVGLDWLGIVVNGLEWFAFLSRSFPRSPAPPTAFSVGGSGFPPGKLNL